MILQVLIESCVASDFDLLHVGAQVGVRSTEPQARECEPEYGRIIESQCKSLLGLLHSPGKQLQDCLADQNAT